MDRTTLLRTAALAALALAPGRLAAEVPDVGPADPSDEEQSAIHALNRARHDPAAYGRQIGVDLASVAPQPPLAVNRSLTGSARTKARDMLENGYFGHVDPASGKGANQLAVDNGYDLYGDGLDKDWGSANYIESIAKGVNLIATFADALALLVEDEGVPSLGHRVHLLGMHAQWQADREIGCGRAAQGTTYLYAIHTGHRGDGDLFLTGVVYSDANGNGRYDKGEGLGGVAVDAGGGRTATSMSAGGWSIQVPAGQHTVTCSGGAFRGTASAQVTVAAANREVDFRSGSATGEVDFGGVSDPIVTLTASALAGPAPLTVDYTAAASADGATFEWDFDEGAPASGAAVSHTFTTPGLRTVVATATAAAGTGRALVPAAAEGPAGAGPGTTPPSSKALAAKSLKAKALFTAAGSDSVTFTAKFEMPAGWTAGLSQAAVYVAGVRQEFALDAADRGADGQGSSISLRYRRPKGGAPLGAGVQARLTVKLRGDRALALSIFGMRDATERRTIAEAPFVLMLGDLAWVGTADVKVSSKAGVRSSATLSR